MRIPAIKKRKWIYLALAFAIPALGMLTVMLVGSRAPFGHFSMLYSDMYHQYYPFFVDFRRALVNGDGLLYNWSIGMGMDYLGLIAYYLASPFNLLSVLVPEKWLLGYFSLTVPVKLGFAGLFFAVFLKGIFRKNDLSVSIFGGFYALCAWALGYLWNIMWLDTFALLPLVALGTVELLRDKRFGLYTVCLFLSVFINYYIGLFTCFFVFLLFFCYEICRWRGFRRFFADLVRIAFFSALAIGMTAVLELPALAALQNTQSSVNKFPEGFELNITSDDTWRGFLDAMRQVAGNMGGGVEPTYKEGLPNVYCGVGSVLLAVLFLTSGKVRLRDKLCSVGLLLFFMASFIIRKLDYIWHGMHFPNMIPYRFSFLFSFVVLYMAYRAFLMRRRFRPWQLAAALVLTALMLFAGDHRGELGFIVCNAVFLLLYFLILLVGVRRKRPPERAPGGEEGHEAVDEADAGTGGEDGENDTHGTYLQRLVRRDNAVSLMLGGILVLELAVNLVNFGVTFPGIDVSNYPKGTQDAAAVFEVMREREDGTLFYRAETTHTQTLNDGALNGYNGISAFTSSANVRVTEFMRALGLGARNTSNRYFFEEGSPVANLFLGLKYMVERDGSEKENRYFTEVSRRNKVILLENNAYLPLGFFAGAGLGEVDFTDNRDVFTRQNAMLEAASGVEGEFWRAVSTWNLEITGTEGVEVSPTAQSRYCTYTCDERGGKLSYVYTADSQGLACVHLHLSGKNSFSIYKNGELVVSDSYSMPQTLSVCQARPGDVFEIRISCPAREKGSMNIKAAILDEELFRRAYDALLAAPLELTVFKSTRVEGTIDCGGDGLVYTSIPDDGNWLALVDGEPVEPVLVGGVMLALPVTAGSHTVAFLYRNAAFSLGWKISLGCAGTFLAVLGLSRLRRRTRTHQR